MKGKKEKENPRTFQINTCKEFPCKTLIIATIAYRIHADYKLQNYVLSLSNSAS